MKEEQQKLTNKQLRGVNITICLLENNNNNNNKVIEKKIKNKALDFS